VCSPPKKGEKKKREKRLYHSIPTKGRFVSTSTIVSLLSGAFLSTCVFASLGWLVGCFLLLLLLLLFFFSFELAPILHKFCFALFFVPEVGKGEKEEER
jgi:hypothetical protein